MSATQTRVLRFAALTAFGAPTNFVLYALLLQVTALSAAHATIIAAMFVIVPKFALSKYWVWRASNSDRLAREISVYCGVTAASLAFAAFVGWTLETGGAGNALLVAGNLGAFTLMWVLRFLVLDRFGFTTATAHQS